jgi:carbonic anhydrase
VSHNGGRGQKGNTPGLAGQNEFCRGILFASRTLGTDVVKEIIAGVRAFQRDVFPRYRELFAQLSAGQSPRAMVISCSDSRVDPFLFTQAEPGHLFVLRNAGNIVPQLSSFAGGVTATIEFAVVELKVPSIIVCGHSGCGAMAGLLHPEQIRHLPKVGKWLEHAAEARRMVEESGGLDAPDAMERAVEANVVVQLANLKTHPSVAAALEAGTLGLHGWVYDLPSGSVVAYEAGSQRFVPL